MKRKAQWKRFWSLSRHQAGGFTLVELIVVIAILGILAGAGTAGYAGYVKSANKNADKVLVGNIIRAIETGTNSTMFVNEDSIDFGMATRPVGFVVLNSTGAKVVTPGSTVKYVEGACDIREITGVTFVKASTLSKNCTGRLCTGSAEATVYTVQKNQTIQYCHTHSDLDQLPKPAEKTETYHSDFSVSANKWHTEHSASKTGGTEVKAGEFVAFGGVGSQLYAPVSGGLCELAYAQQNGIVTSKPVNENVTSGPIYEALQAAFGDVSGLKLTYNGWNSDEGQGYATLYPAASGLVDNLSSLAGNLATLSQNNPRNMWKLSGTYEDSAELFAAVASKFNEAYPNTEEGLNNWIEAWNGAANETDGKSGFGLEPYTNTGEGREYYYSARRLYNEAFASYLEANNVSTATANLVRTHGEGIGEYKLPLVVNTHTIDAALSGVDAATVTTCKTLYSKYVGSASSDENAKAVFNLLNTMVATEDLALNANNGVYDPTIKDDGKNYINYYKQYVNEISTLYNKAQTMAGDGIIIMVFTENDIVSCDVSPSAANPRNG